MFMVSEYYALKRSRVSIVFQLSVLLLISVVLFFTLNLVAAIACLLGMLATWIGFRHSAKLQYLQHLDQSEWSLKFQNKSTIQRVRLEKMIQHHFYVVIYFHDKKHKPVVIWKDQLDLLSWKKLLTRCHLN